MVNAMTTLVIKNLPEELHARLRAQAQRNRRSLTKEAVTVLEQGLMRESARLPLPPPVQLRSGRTLTVEEIESAIADDRYAHYKSLDEVNRYMDELRADRDESTQ